MRLITQNTYSPIVGPIDIAIQAVCKDHTFSELYEIGALCNVLKCNIRSIYPKIDVRDHTAIANNIFMPRPPIVTDCEITVLWSNTSNEKQARIANNSTWSPNHFVPLMSPFAQRQFDNNNQSSPVLVVSSLSMNENWHILNSFRPLRRQH